MSRINDHHITYNPQWTVEITGQMHRTITSIQITKATPDHYARLTNFLHSIAHEWNRMRAELDIKEDFRYCNITPSNHLQEKRDIKNAKKIKNKKLPIAQRK
jgi:hypothetical protein